MKSLTEGLPSEIAKRIHPDWKKNETDYWAHRDELLAQYRGQWIGFANGRVIVAGSSPVEVFHKAQESGEHPFITCVGHEPEPSRMRRASLRHEGLMPSHDYEEFIAALNAHGVRYLVIGAHAVAFHARPRATNAPEERTCSSSS